MASDHNSPTIYILGCSGHSPTILPSFNNNSIDLLVERAGTGEATVKTLSPKGCLARYGRRTGRQADSLALQGGSTRNWLWANLLPFWLK